MSWFLTLIWRQTEKLCFKGFMVFWLVVIKTWLSTCKMLTESAFTWGSHAISCFPCLISFSAMVSLAQIENYIKESMKTEMAQLQQSAVHNHTAAMLEMGTNLLSQTAEQTRKLTDVETQVTQALQTKSQWCSQTLKMCVPHSFLCLSLSHALRASILCSINQTIPCSTAPEGSQRTCQGQYQCYINAFPHTLKLFGQASFLSVLNEGVWGGGDGNLLS